VSWFSLPCAILQLAPLLCLKPLSAHLNCPVRRLPKQRNKTQCVQGRREPSLPAPIGSSAGSLATVLRACQQEISCLLPPSIFVLLREAYSHVCLFEGPRWVHGRCGCLPTPPAVFNSGFRTACVECFHSAPRAVRDSPTGQRCRLRSEILLCCGKQTTASEAASLPKEF